MSHACPLRVYWNSEYRFSWREAAAVVFECVRKAQELEGSDMGRIAPASCLVTRGGEIVVSAGRANPEAVAQLAADLLTGCADRGDLGAALDAGRLMRFLETLGHETTWKRRRVQIAMLALRSLAAEADRARAEGRDVGAPSAHDGARQVLAPEPSQRPHRAGREGRNSASPAVATPGGPFANHPG